MSKETKETPEQAEARKSVAISFKNAPSRTKSEFKDEVNINNIVKLAVKTGALPQGTREALHADFSEIDTYEAAQIKIAEANSAFEQLPSAVREKFANDVTNLLDFVDDENNMEEAIQMGLLPEQEQPLPVATEQSSTAPKVTESHDSSNTVDS